jgi:hypothetical protein
MKGRKWLIFALDGKTVSIEGMRATLEQLR